MVDANLFNGSAVTKNMREIQAGIDSLNHKSDSTGHAVYGNLRTTTYNRKSNIRGEDSARIVTTPPACFDTIYSRIPLDQRLTVIKNAMQKTHVAVSEYEFRSLVSKDIDQALRIHRLEWHKKFTLIAGLHLLLLHGAPLGAIIPERQDWQLPVVLSVVMFIFYYIVNASGEKLAKAGEWDVWFGEWLSSMVLCPIGIFLTYKANNDSTVFNIEAYISLIRRLLGLRISRHIARK